MKTKGKTINADKQVYPLSLSLGLITAAVILSFVDLMFLNDVIGKVLDLGLTESMVIAFGQPRSFSASLTIGSASSGEASSAILPM